MVAELSNKQKSLYDSDYNLWILETVKNLENRNLDSLDWENLIEEVLDLSKRDKRKIESFLMRLIEHLLILEYWETEKEKNRGHWQREITNFRKQIKRILQDSPSLKNHLQNQFKICYKDGRDLATKHSQLPLDIFPENSIAPLIQILDENWLP
jgi:hypothetical protein